MSPKKRSSRDAPRKKTAARPKLKDIADLCGVSVGTVSRVLNGDEAFSVRDAVREKIVETASHIGYAPDLAARSLHRGTTKIIGVFGSPHTHVSEGINDAIFAGIAEAAGVFEYDVFFELTSYHTEARPLPFWRFDGAILIQAPEPALVEALDSRRIPYVSVNETHSHAAASIVSDDEGGATLAMQHLSQLGHEAIAYANVLSGYFPHYSKHERHDAIAGFCDSHGLTLVPGHDDFFDSGERFLQDAVVRHGATAVIAYDHRIAITLLGAAYRLKLRIPDAFSLLCFNDEFPVAQVYPPFTVVAVSGQEMGREAARLLMRVIDRDLPRRDRQELVRVPERLIVRESTAAPPPTG